MHDTRKLYFVACGLPQHDGYFEDRGAALSYASWVSAWKKMYVNLLTPASEMLFSRTHFATFKEGALLWKLESAHA